MIRISIPSTCFAFFLSSPGSGSSAHELHSARNPRTGTGQYQITCVSGNAVFLDNLCEIATEVPISQGRTGVRRTPACDHNSRRIDDFDRVMIPAVYECKVVSGSRICPGCTSHRRRPSQDRCGTSPCRNEKRCILCRLGDQRAPALVPAPHYCHEPSTSFARAMLPLGAMSCGQVG